MTTAHPTIDSPRSSSLRRNLLGLLAVIAVAVVAVLASSWFGRHEVTTVDDPVTSTAAAVDWSHYQPDYRRRLASASCTDLAGAMAAAQLVDGAVDSHAVEAYIAALATAKGCS